MLTISDTLNCIRTGDYTAWKDASLRERWAMLKEAEAADRLGEIATALHPLFGRSTSKVSVGAEINRRADPEKAAARASWFR